MEDFGSVEYRVKPVTRYLITKFESRTGGGGVSTRGEYDNPDVAWEVAYALCKADHERYGYPLDDARIQYPRHPRDETASPAREAKAIPPKNAVA